MVIHFNKKLDQAITTIGSAEYHQFEIPAGETTSEEFLRVFGEINWKIIDSLNETYSHLLKDEFDLHNWLNFNEKDELAYFLSEAGQNCFNHAEKPERFHLWLGEKGFVLGIEQKQGFNAEEVNEKRIKDNEGAAFEFFRNCKNEIFFDRAKEAKTVYMEFKF